MSSLQILEARIKDELDRIGISISFIRVFG